MKEFKDLRVVNTVVSSSKSILACLAPDESIVQNNKQMMHWLKTPFKKVFRQLIGRQMHYKLDADEASYIYTFQYFEV